MVTEQTTLDHIRSHSLDKVDNVHSRDVLTIQVDTVLSDTTHDPYARPLSLNATSLISHQKRIIEPMSIQCCRKPLSHVLLQSMVVLSPHSPTFSPLDGEFKSFNRCERIRPSHEQPQQQVDLVAQQQQQAFPPNLSLQAKLLFLCSMRDDSAAASLLQQIHEEYNFTPQNLNSVRDPKRQDCSLMHLCAKNNLVQCMELLAKYGCLVDAPDSLGATPLFYACANGCNDAAAFLIVMGSNVNAKDSYQKFPLLVAISNHRYDTVDMLLLMKADIELKGARGHTCLHYFAEMGHLGHVQYLIERQHLSASKRNAQDDNVLAVAVRHAHIVQYLTSFYRGMQLFDLVKQQNRNRQTAIHLCCAGGHFESLHIILTSLQRDLPNKNNWAKEILNQVDRSGYTPLILATLSSNEKLIALLSLCAEVDVDAQDIGGDCALHKAIAKRDSVAARILTRFGSASIHVRNKGKVSCEDASKLMHFEKELFEECRHIEELRSKEASRRTKEYEKERKRLRRGFGGDPIRNLTHKHNIFGNILSRMKVRRPSDSSITSDNEQEHREGTDPDVESSGSSNEDDHSE